MHGGRPAPPPAEEEGTDAGSPPGAVRGGPGHRSPDRGPDRGELRGPVPRGSGRERLPRVRVEGEPMSTRVELATGREKGIGGSDAASVFNLSPFCSAFNLYQIKRG